MQPAGVVSSQSPRGFLKNAVETTTGDLAARIERLEQTMSRAHLNADPFAKISFAGWLKISGPTFAVMALGFGALWNAQQATTQQIMDLQQDTTQQIMDLQQVTTQRIFEMQEETAAKILALQETTTDQILGLQQQILDLHRASAAERG